MNDGPNQDEHEEIKADHAEIEGLKKDPGEESSEKSEITSANTNADETKKKKSFFKTKSFWIITSALLFAFISLWKRSEPTIVDKVYRIAFDQSWPTANLGSRHANMSAFSRTILYSIAKEQNLHIVIYSTSLNLTKELQSEEFNGFLTNLSLEPSSKIDYLYSRPLYQLGPVMVVAKSSSFIEAHELKGKTLGIMKGVNYRFEEEISRLISYESEAQAYQDLARNRIQGLIMGALQAYGSQLDHSGETFRILSPPLAERGIRLVIKNEEDNQDEDFMEAFDHGLSEMLLNGTYHELIDKWDLVDTMPEAAKS